ECRLRTIVAALPAKPFWKRDNRCSAKTFRCEAGVEIWQSNEGAMNFSRRGFLKMAAAVTGGVLLPRVAERVAASGPMNRARQEGAAVYSIRIGASPVEIAPQRIVSTGTYNGQFPGPLLRFKEGQPVTIDIHNDTDTPEQLHWHGQKVPVDVDGATEEGTPFIPADGKRRITFTPGPSGFRFSHTHNRAGANLSAGQYSGQVGPVYIEPAQEPG